jgi:hypothetical protein
MWSKYGKLAVPKVRVHRGKFKDRTGRSGDILLVELDTYLIDEAGRCMRIGA